MIYFVINSLVLRLWQILKQTHLILLRRPLIPLPRWRNLVQAQRILLQNWQIQLQRRQILLPTGRTLLQRCQTLLQRRQPMGTRKFPWIVVIKTFTGFCYWITVVTFAVDFRKHKLTRIVVIKIFAISLYCHSHFLAASFDFITFFTLAILNRAAPFLQPGFLST